MGWFSKSSGNPHKSNSKVNWENLTDINQLKDIKNESNEIPVLIYKHSTRCSVSIMAKNHLDNNWDIQGSELKCYYLDLLKHRDISNQIAEDFDVIHQSPQVIIIKNGDAIYNASHSSIEVRAIRKQIK
ncbi:MAG: bacillithiol system redox-active protein YtxJ [Putridiphycobacter sp.]